MTDPHAKPPAQPFRGLRRLGSVLLVVALLASGLVVVAAAVYWLNGDVAPAPLREHLFDALAVLVVALLLGGHIPGLYWLGRWRRDPPDRTPEQYAELRRQTQFMQAQQAAYAADSTALATCAHLQPVEKAMRQSGIVLRLHHGQAVDAACRIDEAALAQRFSLTLPVFYSDEVPGHLPSDPLGAMLACREHGACIWVVHPADATPKTPWFPRAGSLL